MVLGHMVRPYAYRRGARDHAPGGEGVGRAMRIVFCGNESYIGIYPPTCNRGTPCDTCTATYKTAFKRREQGMTKAKLTKLEKIFKEDIRWAIRNGFKWNARVGAHVVDGKWVSNEFSSLSGSKKKTCGVCAVAAHVIHHQTNCSNPVDTVLSAAKDLKVKYEWLDTLFYSVMDDPKDPPYYRDSNYSAVDLGHKLRDYAVAYTKKYKAAKKLKAALQRRTWKT